MDGVDGVIRKMEGKEEMREITVRFPHGSVAGLYMAEMT